MVKNEFEQLGHDHQTNGDEEPRLNQDDLHWLVGILEVGGHFRIAQSYQGELLIPGPFIQVGMQPQQIESFYRRFGGSVFPKSNNHSVVIIRGKHAVELVTLLEPYLIKYSNLVKQSLEVYRLFLEAAASDVTYDVTEYFEEVESADGDEFVEISPEEYIELVKNPVVVAGIIDNRGSFYNNTTAKKSQTNNPVLQVHSANKSLLEALSWVYGGSVQLLAPAGTFFAIDDRQSQTHQDAYCWRLNSGGLRKNLPDWEPYLSRKPYTGWQRTMLGDRLLTNEEVGSSISELMRNEIQQVAEGSFNVSSIDSILDLFGLTKKQWPNFCQRYVDKDVLNQHFELRNRLLQRKTEQETLLFAADHIRSLFSQWKQDGSIILWAKRYWRKLFKENFDIELSINDTHSIQAYLGEEFFSEYAKAQQQQAQILANPHRKKLRTDEQLESIARNKKLGIEVNLYLQTEIDRYNSGDLVAFSTTSELIEKFNLSKTSWQYFKETYLDLKIVDEHSRLRRSHNQKKR